MDGGPAVGEDTGGRGVASGRAHSPLGSVVIAAYDEETVIGPCLDALLAGFGDGELDVVVVANGCSDSTAAVAKAFPVHVLELPEPSKAAALRAGDLAVTAFPRIYLDADVVLPGASARSVLDHLRREGAVAARPPFRYDTGRSAALVRRYYRARQRLPSMMDNVWGAGVYALSEAGRGRFGPFPDVTADDLFVQQQVGEDELVVVDCDEVVVRAPRTPADLLQVLRRQHRGKQMLAGPERADTAPAALRELAQLLRRGPSAAADAVVYATFAALSRHRRRAPAVRWERDASSRRA